MFKELSFCKSQIPQPEKHEVRGLGAYVSIFFKAMWFYLKKAEFDFNKICTHYSKGRDNFAVLKILSWQLCFLKNKPRVKGLGRGFEEGLHTRVGLQVWITGMHPLEVVGPPKSRILLDWWLSQPAPRRSLHNHCLICISLFPIYYLTGHSTSSQAEIDVNSAPRRNLDLHAQLLVLEMSLTSTLAASPVSLLYAPFSL